VEIIAQIKDHDCSDNRLLQFTTDYLNRKYDHDNLFYGEALNIVSTHTPNNIKFYSVNLNVYTVKGDCIKVHRQDISIDENDGKIILRIHAVRELERKIHANKINKI
jgi:hypothetical protein